MDEGIAELIAQARSKGSPSAEPGTPKRLLWDLGEALWSAAYQGERSERLTGQLLDALREWNVAAGRMRPR